MHTNDDDSLNKVTRQHYEYTEREVPLDNLWWAHFNIKNITNQLDISHEAIVHGSKGFRSRA